MKSVLRIAMTTLITAFVFWQATGVRSEGETGSQDYVVAIQAKSNVLLPCICRGVKMRSARFDSPSTAHDSRLPLTVSVVNPSENPLNYQYSVTGGRIIGRGPAVYWDFSQAGPGEYSVSVEI